MKSEGNKWKSLKGSLDSKIINKKGYYFHSDEDFKEDYNWGKEKVVASKALSKRTNKFEI